MRIKYVNEDRCNHAAHANRLILQADKRVIRVMTIRMWKLENKRWCMRTAVGGGNEGVWNEDFAFRNGNPFLNG